MDVVPRHQVVGIGGGSSVGKTTLAKQFLAQAHAKHVAVDEIVAGLSDERLGFPPFPDGSSGGFGETLFQWLLVKHEVLEPHLRREIESALAADEPTVIEGEGLTPMLLSEYASDGLRGGFVIEHHEARIGRTLRARSERFRLLPDERQAAVVQMNVLYNCWIEDEASRLGVAAVASQPWSTLPGRFHALTSTRELAASSA